MKSTIWNVHPIRFISDLISILLLHWHANHHVR